MERSDAVPGEDRPGEVTRLLQQLGNGEDGAAQGLFELIYDELHRLAGKYMAGQSAGSTLQPTALVHEAYVRLFQHSGSRWEDRTHFFRTAARAMRSALVDHARSKDTAKRGVGLERVPLDAVLLGFDERSFDFLDLDAALSGLAEVDEELTRLVELRFFAGLTNDATAELLGMSRATVERRWRVARAWLRHELEGGS